jgi:hypothetical protein
MRSITSGFALLTASPAFAGGASLAVTQVPTLGEFGLVGLIAAVGIVAGLVVRRRKR